MKTTSVCLPYFAGGHRSRILPRKPPISYDFFSGGSPVRPMVRALESTDSEEDLARLRTLVRPQSPEAYDAERQLSIWRWLESHPLADRMHRWVLEAQGRIVGHLAALPQYYYINGRRVVAHTPAEYMVLPKHGFHAITLMRKFFRTCENCVTTDTAPSVIGIETRLGAEEAGRLQFGAKLWNIAALPHFATSVPAPLRRPSNWALRTADVALDRIAFVDGLETETLEIFDKAFDGLFQSVAAAVPCVLEKDATFLRWRYGPGSPQYPVTILGVKDAEALLGYAVLRVSNDGNTGYLLDLMTRPGRHDVARTLLHQAVRHFRRLRVHSARYRFAESCTSPRKKDLWRSGLFLASKGRQILLIRFSDSVLHKTANDAVNWSYSYGDGEGSFWVT
jgi:hypothetical protein